MIATRCHSLISDVWEVSAQQKDELGNRHRAGEGARNVQCIMGNGYMGTALPSPPCEQTDTSEKLPSPNFVGGP